MYVIFASLSFLYGKKMAIKVIRNIRRNRWTTFCIRVESQRLYKTSIQLYTCIIIVPIVFYLLFVFWMLVHTVGIYTNVYVVLTITYNFTFYEPRQIVYFFEFSKILTLFLLFVIF